MLRRNFLKTAAGAAACGAFADTPEKPNIVLIYADDLGYGDIGCYGASKVRTPNLDRLAGGGVRFTDAHASSATCTPSRYSLLTGEYAWRRKGTGVLPGNAPALLRPGRATLASTLHNRGYRTGAVGKWHLGLGDGTLDWNGEIRPGPLEIGFDYAFIMPATGDRVPCVYVENHRVVGLDPKDPIRVSYERPIGNEPTGRQNPELLRMRSSHGHDQAIVNGVGRIGYMTGGRSALWNDETMADTLTSKAAGFIENSPRKQPFFLYFATHDIHVPRLPNGRFAGKTGMGPRGDAIAELDWSVGQILDKLDRLGLAKNTLVLFSSDNGPVVDDGYQDEAVERLGDHKPAGTLRGGKYSRFEGGTRVPLLARWPGHIKPDLVSGALVSQVDFFASFALIAGTQPGPNEAPDSLNQANALLGRDPRGRDYVVEHAGALAVTQGGWKYIEPSPGQSLNRNTNTETANDPQPQLYDLKKDIGEKDNVAAAHPDVVNKLSALLDRVRK